MRRIKDIISAFSTYPIVSIPDKVRGSALAYKYNYLELSDIDITKDVEYQKKVLINYYKLMLSKYDYEEAEENENEGIRSLYYGDYRLPIDNFFLTEKNDSGRFNITNPNLRSSGYGYTIGNPGIDLFTIYDIPGDNVYAVYDGIVVSVMSDNVHGIMMWIYHPELERYTGYGHLNDLKVVQGQTVKTGDVIALVGRTATPDTIRTFLHFEYSICDPVISDHTPQNRIDPVYIIDFDKMSWGNIDPLK
jgi:murein DD-endopeptidase MepM/ murein hydrolase activator NlpD